MGEKKSSAILLTVIGIATLIVTLVGATFAYFTAIVEPSENSVDTDVTITAAELGTIVFKHEDTINLTNAYPGNSDSVEFSITAAEKATAGVDYQVYLIVTTNTFTSDNLKGTLTAPQGAKTNNLATATSLSNTGAYAVSADGVLIGEGTIQPSTTDTWVLDVSLLETHDIQNVDQGKSFVAQIFVKVEGEGEYTQQSVYGTN